MKPMLMSRKGSSASDVQALALDKKSTEQPTQMASAIGEPASGQTMTHPICTDIRPLHIIKRSRASDFGLAGRESSQCSMRHSPDRPLNVMKRRLLCNSIDEAAADNRAIQEQNTSLHASPKICSSLRPKAEHPPLTQRGSEPQTRRRWFSRQRTSSSGTTRRRYTSSNNSSIRQLSSSLGVPDEASTPNTAESHSAEQTDTSFSSIPASPIYDEDCHLLVPRISVTPEVQMSRNAVATVWATIEISVQLSRPYTDSVPHLHHLNESSMALPNPPRPGSVSRFGYLYNLQVDVFPVPQTALVEVIRGDEKRDLHLGSSMLVLAKIQIGRRLPERLGRPIAHRSDALIADIENTLEAAPDIKYLRVRLRYNHSGFPASGDLTPVKGAVACQTRLETSVVGVISQQALRVPRRDLSPVNMSESSLFGVVASYWGPFRANQIFPAQQHRPALHQSRPRALDDAIPLRRNRRMHDINDDDDDDDDGGGFEYSIMTEPDPCTPKLTLASPRPRPRLRRSLCPLPPQSSPPELTRQRLQQQQLQGRNEEGNEEEEEEEEGEDPAHKIWTQMRRRTSRTHPTNYDYDYDSNYNYNYNYDFNTNTNTSISPTTPTPKIRISAWDSYPSNNNVGGGSLRLKSAIDRRRDLIRDAALRNRRSIGADTLKSLVPSMMSLDLYNNGGAWGDDHHDDYHYHANDDAGNASYYDDDNGDNDGSSNSNGDRSRHSGVLLNKENVPPERRKEGRWNLGGWW